MPTQDNYILMHIIDYEKREFVTDKCIYYCCKVMPFSLKNARVTYQRLVNHMFKEQLRDKMEVYIDDILVKSKKFIDHVQHIT